MDEIERGTLQVLATCIPRTFLGRMACLALLAALLAAWPVATAPIARAAEDSAASRPYDQKLLRLTEILGALHYLRELCGANDGQKWRDGMQDLMRGEGSSALRRATLARSFNRGYRGYGRTYRNCTNSARATIDRFLKEAAQISNELLKLAN
ncbi:MAG TPA: TIGR02301 family protein [Hyphomicrobiaceae bacterium]|nr:TIGR02301 family protein [Hyphomicrobiaceae bacterium]